MSIFAIWLFNLMVLTLVTGGVIFILAYWRQKFGTAWLGFGLMMLAMVCIGVAINQSML